MEDDAEDNKDGTVADAAEEGVTITASWGESVRLFPALIWDQLTWRFKRRRKRKATLPRTCSVCGRELGSVGNFIVRPDQPETAMHAECWEQLYRQESLSSG